MHWQALPKTLMLQAVSFMGAAAREPGVGSFSDSVPLQLWAAAVTLPPAALVHCLQVGCDFRHKPLEANKQAYADPRLHLIYNDAREELELYEGKFDVIIGDLADPVDGGPCYQVMCLRTLPCPSGRCGAQSWWQSDLACCSQ